MNKIVKKLVNRVYQSATDWDYDKEIYIFGIIQGIMIIFNMLFTLIIGLIMGLFFESIVFSICYFSLRRFSGGYHAVQPRNCLFLSILLLIANLKLIANVKMNLWTILIFIIAGVTIFKLAPVESMNKPLDLLEKVVFRKSIRRRICIQFIIACLLFYSFQRVSMCIIAAFISDALMLVIGKMLITTNKVSVTTFTLK